MSNRLKNKVAIITGGASGLGFAGVKLFLQEGAKVVVVDYDQKQTKKTVGPLIEAGKSVIAIQADVSKEEDWAKVVKQTLAKFGKIDILVNNAGVHVAQDVLHTNVAD